MLIPVPAVQEVVVAILVGKLIRSMELLGIINMGVNWILYTVVAKLMLFEEEMLKVEKRHGAVAEIVSPVVKNSLTEPSG